jgi:hypothetical protein
LIKLIYSLILYTIGSRCESIKIDEKTLLLPLARNSQVFITTREKRRAIHKGIATLYHIRST